VEIRLPIGCDAVASDQRTKCRGASSQPNISGETGLGNHKLDIQYPDVLEAERRYFCWQA
jgi:hypothetical protein